MTPDLSVATIAKSGRILRQIVAAGLQREGHWCFCSVSPKPAVDAFER
jgi:hypothetical protein